jgi:hypothetical protein
MDVIGLPLNRSSLGCTSRMLRCIDLLQFNPCVRRSWSGHPILFSLQTTQCFLFLHTAPVSSHRDSCQLSCSRPSDGSSRILLRCTTASTSYSAPSTPFGRSCVSILFTPGVFFYTNSAFCSRPLASFLTSISAISYYWQDVLHYVFDK